MSAAADQRPAPRRRSALLRCRDARAAPEGALLAPFGALQPALPVCSTVQAPRLGRSIFQG